MSVLGTRQSKYLRTNQSGMASIMITMITMIVVSLIVLGFATISRREQGNTLDQQLSTQAFYAAETGIEDARNVIMNDVKTNQPILPKTNCATNTGGATYPTGNQTVLDAAHSVSYTCLLVNPNVTSVVFDGVDQQSKVLPISATQTITSVVVSWTPTSNPAPSTANCPGSAVHTFSPATQWTCDYGVLRMDLVPTQGALTRGGLESSTLTSFFEPVKAGGSPNLSYAGSVGKANVTPVNCAGTQCSVTIVGLSATDDLAMRLNSIYQASNVTINAYHGGTLLDLSGQVMVDATGNANGVLRRIQVRIPTTYSSNLIPDDAIQSNAAICKRFEVDSTYFSIPSDIVNPDPGNAMCQSVTSGSP
jgi:Tfp pilus assembly protein PilX